MRPLRHSRSFGSYRSELLYPLPIDVKARHALPYIYVNNDLYDSHYFRSLSWIQGTDGAAGPGAYPSDPLGDFALAFRSKTPPLGRNMRSLALGSHHRVATLGSVTQTGAPTSGIQGTDHDLFARRASAGRASANRGRFSCRAGRVPAVREENGVCMRRRTVANPQGGR